jgi:hypothetical protein
MASPKGARAAPGVSRCDPQNLIGVGDGSISPSNAIVRHQRQELLDHLDVIEKLSLWKLELQAKLWRKRQVFLYADSDADFRSLADEVRDFKRVSALLTYMRKSAL